MWIVVCYFPVVVDCWFVAVDLGGITYAAKGNRFLRHVNCKCRQNYGASWSLLSWSLYHRGGGKTWWIENDFRGHLLFPCFTVRGSINTLAGYDLSTWLQNMLASHCFYVVIATSIISSCLILHKPFHTAHRFHSSRIPCVQSRLLGNFTSKIRTEENGNKEKTNPRNSSNRKRTIYFIFAFDLDFATSFTSLSYVDRQ